MPAPQATAYAKAVQGYTAGSESMLAVLHRLRRIFLHPRSHYEQDPDEYIAQSARRTEAFRILDNVNR